MQWLKYTIFSLIAVFVPIVAFAAFAVPWSASSTSQGWITPVRVNGVEQTPVAQIYIATSTTASSTFANGLNLTKGCFSVLGTCIGSGNGTVTQGNYPQLAIYATDGSTLSGTTTSPLTIGSFVATSSTATSSIYGNLFIGTGGVPNNCQFLAGQPLIMCDTFDGGSYQAIITNNSKSAFALTSWDMGNDLSTNAGFSSSYFCGIFEAGSQYNVPGFNGIKPSGGAFTCSDGPISIGSASFNTASSSIYMFFKGGGFDGADAVFYAPTGGFGLGTTTPHWSIQDAGIRPLFVLSDTNAGVNAKHWFQASEGGFFYMGTSSDVFATTTLLSINPTGSFGIGTTTQGTAKLTVQNSQAGNILDLRSQAGASQLSVTNAGALTLAGNMTINGTTVTATNVTFTASQYNTGSVQIGGGAYLCVSITQCSMGNSGSGTGGNTTINGTAGSDGVLNLKSTNGVGTADSIRLSVGNNGGTISEFINTYGSVGIGTTTPLDGVDIVARNIASTSLRVTGRFTSQTADVFQVAQAPTSSPQLEVTAAGKVGIASSTPWRTLDVGGTVSFKGLTAFTTGDSAVCLSANNEITFDSGVSSCIVSSKLVKHDIINLDVTNSTARIMKLNPVSFTYNVTNRKDLGLIAEDVAEVDPRYAQYNNQTGKPAAINWSAVTADLVKVVQSQQKQIDALTIEVNQLKQNGQNNN